MLNEADAVGLKDTLNDMSEEDTTRLEKRDKTNRGVKWGEIRRLALLSLTASHSSSYTLKCASYANTILPPYHPPPTNTLILYLLILVI